MISLWPTLQAARAGRSLFTTAPAALVGCTRLLSPPHRKPLFCTAFSVLRFSACISCMVGATVTWRACGAATSVSAVGMNSISPHTHLRIVKTNPNPTRPRVNPSNFASAARSALELASQSRLSASCLGPVGVADGAARPPSPPPVQYASHDPADRASAQEARQRSATAGA